MGDGGDVAPVAEPFEPAGAELAVTRIGSHAVAEQQPRAALVVDLLQLLQLRADGLHQPATRRDHLGQSHQLGDVGERAGYRAAIRRLVRLEAVGGEAERPTGHRRIEKGAHALQLRARRLVGERAVAHHVVAKRAVADEAGDIQPRADGLQRVEVLAVGFP